MNRNEKKFIDYIMSEHILIFFELKNDGMPKIFAQYLMLTNDWNKIKKNFDNSFEYFLDDSDSLSEKIMISEDNLKITECTNQKMIDAFRTLHKNYFYNYDLLSFFMSEINRPRELKKDGSFFEMDDDDSDLGYYLRTKKNTPEFSNLDDEKVKKLIFETKKTVNLFKNPNGE